MVEKVGLYFQYVLHILIRGAVLIMENSPDQIQID